MSIAIGYTDKPLPAALQSLNGADPASVAGLPPNMSLDELMGWLGNQMSKTDTQLREQMASMADDKNTQGAIGKAVEELNRLQMADAGDAKDKVEPKWIDPAAPGFYQNEDWYKALSPDAKKTIDTMVSHMGADRPASTEDVLTAGMRAFAINTHYGSDGTIAMSTHVPSGEQQLIDEGRGYRSTDGTLMIHGDHEVSRADVKEAMDGLQNELSSLQSSNETNMIKLQSAVQARSQMIELVSNMVKSFSDTGNSVVRNVGA